MALLGLLAPEANAQTCPITIDATAGGIVNTYYPGLGTVAAAATSLTVNMNAFTGLTQDIAVSDLLLVIQMQDADINSANTDAYGDGTAGDGVGRGQTAVNSTGLYEYVVAQTAAATGSGASVTINITGGGTGNGTINTYRTAARTATTGQRSYQVIKVGRGRNVTLNGVTASPWNGVTGGVVAIDISGTLTLTANSVNVTGLGFRGGVGQALAGEGTLTVTGTDYRRRSATAAHGLKGEGIAGTPANLSGVGATQGYASSTAADPNGDRARGAPGNAGGGGTDSNPTVNDQNSGGGGGGNGGTGGGGGNAWNSAAAVGGFGGAAFPATFGRLVMGGGGGAGTRNNSTGVESSGADGGGIVLIRAALVAGTGTITADGDTANTATFTPDNDGGGGGGAGGSVLFVAPAAVSLANLTISARGGRGSDAWPTQAPNGNPGERHGPGGGGGGGARFTSVAVNAASSVAGGANGITTTVSDAFGSTAGATGVTGTTTFDSIPGVQTCLAVTRAVVSGLRVSGGELEFAVTSGRSVLGFNVIGESATGKRGRLNPEVLLSPLPDSIGPVLYRVKLHGAVPKRVFVEELTRDGRVRSMGPYLPGQPGLAEAYARLEAREQRSEVRDNGSGHMLVSPRPDALAASARPRRPPLPPRGSRGLKITVGGAGLVRVPLEDWRRNGLFLDAVGSGPRFSQRLMVTNLGRSVPFAVRDGFLEFQAESLSTDYTGENAYVVGWGLAPEPRVGLTRSGFARLPGYERVEKNLLYAAFVAQGADPWIWDYAVEGSSGPFAFDLPRLGAGAGSVPVRIGLIGGSDHTHHVSAEINGMPVGEVLFTGKTMGLLVGQVAIDALRTSGNELRLQYEAEDSTPDDPGLVFLDVIDLAIPLVAPQGSAEVLSVEAYDANVGDLGAVDYLVVTHPDFKAAAERLRDQKEGEGFKVALVEVDRAYDRYSSGVVEANAIQALIAELGLGRGPRQRPRYVVLLGDDTYDPRDFLGVGHKSYVPSLYGWDGVFGRVPSETRYADMDGDGRPDVAIGRLPAQTPADADLLVEKIERFKESGARRGHLIAVDESQGADISFRGEGQSLESRLPPGSVSFVDVGAQGVTAARTSLLAGLRRGAQTTSYFGHGGLDIWSNQGLLRTTDAASLEGTGGQTVLFSWTCETQWYLNDDRTISEELLLVPNGGTVASVGPGGISDPALQANLSRRVYEYYLKGRTLGEAVRLGKSDALAVDPTLAPVVQGFSLLGDPSIRLRP